MSMIKGPNGGLVNPSQEGSTGAKIETSYPQTSDGMVQGPNGGWVNSPPKK